jgi:hypothetical protein
MKTKVIKQAIYIKDSSLSFKEIAKIRKQIYLNFSTLHKSARTKSKAQLKTIELIAELAYDFTFELQELFISPYTKHIVEKVAYQRRKLSSTYDLDYPTGLKANIELVNGFGDIMRAKLTHKYKDNNILRFHDQTDFDVLRLTMEGFVKAIVRPNKKEIRVWNRMHSRVDTSKLDSKQYYDIQMTGEMGGLIEIKKETKDYLLNFKNINNPKVWAAEFVNWYKNRHPWPYKDLKSGKDRLIDDGEQIRDYIHMIAYDKLMVRRKSSSSEKSIWTALRVIVQARFKNTLKLTDITI